MKKLSVKAVCASSVVAALYAVLTYVSAAFSLAYGPVQLRISELLTILPLFTPAAIPGLTVGCFLANIGSANAIDLVFGTAATLIAALLTRVLRNKTVKGFPLASFLPPILVNAVMVGFEITAFFIEKFTLTAFLINSAQIALGQAIVLTVLGIPFYYRLKKHSAIFAKLNDK